MKYFPWLKLLRVNCDYLNLFGSGLLVDVSHLNVKPARGKIDKEALNITRSRVEPLKVNKEKEKAAKVSHFTCNYPLSFA